MTHKHGRTDANQSAVVSALRTIGATVTILSDVGQGCPDLLVGSQGINFLFEVKDGNKPPSERQLTGKERTWHEMWRGQVSIVDSPVDAVETLLSLIP